MYDSDFEKRRSMLEILFEHFYKKEITRKDILDETTTMFIGVPTRILALKSK